MMSASGDNCISSNKLGIVLNVQVGYGRFLLSQKKSLSLKPAQCARTRIHIYRSEREKNARMYTRRKERTTDLDITRVHAGYLEKYATT